jgi:ankyrin
MGHEGTSVARRRGLAVLAVMLLPASGLFAGANSAVDLADAAMSRDTARVRALVEEGADVNAFGRDGTPALHWVVRVDDLDTARLLLKAGADPMLPNRYGVTPLYLAAFNGNAALLRLLLDAGADPNAADPTGETALMTAVTAGRADAVAVLLDRGAEVNATDPEFQQTALMMAVREDHPPVVRLLIDRGATVNTRTRIGDQPRWVLPNSVPGFSFGIGIVRGGLPARGSRAPIPGGMTPLLYAARDNRLETARMLVAAGADANQSEANGITPLVMAITNNNMDVARFLIDAGAAVNARDWYGRTPLWVAVETRNLDLDSESLDNGVDREPVLALIRLLLDRGANPDVRVQEVVPIRRWMLGVGSVAWVDFTGQTPFLLASLAGDVTVMRELLLRGADPTIPTYAGTTALMAAAGVNWTVNQTSDEGAKALLDAVKLCIELGLDVNAVNSMGVTALTGAVNRGSNDIVELLVAHGAKLDVLDDQGRDLMTWAKGVFLATHPAQEKPETIALLERLTAGPADGPADGP